MRKSGSTTIPVPRGAGPPPRPPARRPATAAAALVLALAAVTGCSDSGGEAAPGTGAADIARAPRDAVSDGGTLRWAVNSVPATLNAFQPDADQATARIAGAVLPALFRLDARGRPAPDPDFLAAAGVVETEPRQVVRYRLNPHARWSDGTPLTAADFTAQWKALDGRDTAYWTARTAGYERIASVRRGAGAHEVRVTFATPYADWRALFTPLYPKAVTTDPDAFNDASRTALPAVSGPYALKGIDRDAGTVTLVRNAAWWGERPKLDRLVLTAVPRGRRPAALAQGAVDLAEIDLSARAGIGRTKGLAVRKAPEAAYSHLALNGGSGPLADERVRRAVARAIDRQAVADAVLKPLGLPAKALGNHLVLPSQDGYADHSSALGSADPATARALLADEGWKRADSKDSEQSEDAGQEPRPAGAPLRKEGKALTLRLIVPRTSGTLTRVGRQITRMLAGIGVRTELTGVRDDSFFRDHLAAGDFDLALYSWPGTAYPATDARPIFAKPAPAADGSLTVEQNYPRVGTDEIDQLLERASAELAPAAARDLTARADARIWAAAGSLPLYQRPQLVAVRADVANAGAFGFETPRYQDIGFRK